MQISEDVFRQKLPRASLQSAGSQNGHYSTDINVLERIEWHPGGLRGVVQVSPRSRTRESSWEMGGGKFVRGAYVSVDCHLLSARGCELLKIQCGETA